MLWKGSVNHDELMRQIGMKNDTSCYNQNEAAENLRTFAEDSIFQMLRLSGHTKCQKIINKIRVNK